MSELVFGVAQEVLKKLESLAYYREEVCFAWGVKSDMIKLQHAMSTVTLVLLDAEEKQAKDPALREWLEQLKDVFYDADDVVDEIEYKALRKEVVKTYGNTTIKVRHFLSTSNPLAFTFKLGHKMKEIRERFDEIAAKKAKFHLTERPEDMHVLMHGRRDLTHPFVDPLEVMIGRDEDREKIIDLLMNPKYRENKVSVIPIVGVGGLGKTTLATSVYHDGRVVKHFDLKMWVYVYDDFDVPRLIKAILESASGTIIDENLTKEQLQARLRENLKDKKFLLVLDDVRREDSGKWSELKTLLVGGSGGSMILVTTRNKKVALVMGTIRTHTLEGLSEEKSLSLFVKWAFKEGQDKQHPKLLEIGKEIVKKCGGVPLAVRILGCLLYSELDEGRWNSIKDNEIWQIKQKEDGVLPALRLSYNQMPSQLKLCFAYCSLFPKDHEYLSAELIQFWIAHGLLTSPDENQEVEDLGELYIKELWSRSFFQDFHAHLSFYSFKMHDVVHDLALSVAQSECSLVSIGTKTISKKVRHLSFLDNVQEVPTHSNRVRTIMFPVRGVGPFIRQSFVDSCIMKFKYMRVLNLRDSSFEVLSSSISTLKYLRSLDLSFNRRIKKLPNSICKLHSLLSLLLIGCEELEELPRDIRNMISLRFLTITTKQEHLSENGVGCLKSLQFLGIVGCQNLKFLFEGMHRLANLRSLLIAECGSFTSLSRNMKHLTALETISIYDCGELIFADEEDNQEIKLSIKTLIMEHLPKLVVLPEWIRATANTLHCLQIEYCTNFTTLPEWLSSLKSLQKLEIKGCPKLSSLPERMRRLTALRELKIEDCPELSKKYNRETGKDWPKIAHVPNLIIKDSGRS